MGRRRRAVTPAENPICRSDRRPRPNSWARARRANRRLGVAEINRVMVARDEPGRRTKAGDACALRRSRPASLVVGRGDPYPRPARNDRRARGCGPVDRPRRRSRSSWPSEPGATVSHKRMVSGRRSDWAACAAASPGLHAYLTEGNEGTDATVR